MPALTEKHFRDRYLYEFFRYGISSTQIPSNLTDILARKLDMINAAKKLKDLAAPPGNRLELLKPKKNRIYSIRVNKQYRLIFKYHNNKITHLHLDPHSYDL